MLSFIDFYLSEKTIDTNKPRNLNPQEQICIDYGKKLADKFGFKLNGWMENSYVFTIPEGVPDEKNTLMGKSESEIIEKLKERFPSYLEYIIKKGYEPSEDGEVPEECGKPFDDM
jgi:hypothetical protein